MTQSYVVKDIQLAPQGRQKIEWVSRWMSVVNGLKEKFAKDGLFEGKKIAMCIHLEAKTAYLAMVMKELGAEVWITSSNPDSAKDDVCAALADAGVHVFARHGASKSEYESFVESIVSGKPNAIVDDGGDVCDYLHKHPEYASDLIGICEETTTGVVRLKKKAASGKLKYPALAINDAQSKFLFDNRYGTGQSTWTAIMHLTNLNVVGKTVVCVGYGWVGRGVAMRAAGLGAEVIVTEIDPWKAWEARMEGFRVMPIEEAAPLGDFFVTNTGEDKVIRLEHIHAMKDGAFLANAGHFGYEIDVPGLQKIAESSRVVREEIEEFVLPNGRRVYLLANGSIINIAGGLGHPVEIMDMSFSLQLASIHYLLSQKSLETKVYKVPTAIDELVVREKMNVENIRIDEDLRGKN